MFKNSEKFVRFVGMLQLAPTDLLMSFDVVSLHTRVPIRETLELLKLVFTEEIVNLFLFVLSSLYFLFNGVFYEQMEEW